MEDGQWGSKGFRVDCFIELRVHGSAKSNDDVAFVSAKRRQYCRSVVRVGPEGSFEGSILDM